MSSIYTPRTRYNTLANIWDGSRWIVSPMRVFDGLDWNLIDYVMSQYRKLVFFPINVNDTVSIVTQKKELSMFNNPIGVDNGRDSQA